MLEVVQYIRAERKSTGSWITFKLPNTMKINNAECYFGKVMHEWEFVMACLNNPDED